MDNDFERAFQRAAEEAATRRAAEEAAAAESSARRQQLSLELRSVTDSYLRSIAPSVQSRLIELRVPLKPGTAMTTRWEWRQHSGQSVAEEVAAPSLHYWELGPRSRSDSLKMSEDGYFMCSASSSSGEEGYEDLLARAVLIRPLPAPTPTPDSGNRRGPLAAEEGTGRVVIWEDNRVWGFADYLASQIIPGAATATTPISWSFAVAAADSALLRYSSALQQVGDLVPLVASYLQAVKDAGKWPRYGESQDSPGELMSSGGYLLHGRQRVLRASYDGRWSVRDATLGDEAPEVVCGYDPASGPSVGPLSAAPEMFMIDPDFDLYMAAVERVRRWLPSDLVNHLRSMGIPIPDD